ncbi:MAG TPA: hypothetical protein VK137_14355, partial [Planctomycetaceae bacterium]|nr:hypothetical protein [Planctomycetaceae bacterium]
MPYFLRTPSPLPKGTVVRPLLAADSSPSAGRKINGGQPTPMINPNNRAVRLATEPPSAVIQPVNQDNGPPSPVQQQLEELYRQDGRQMPPMNLQQAPNTQPPATTPNNRAVMAAPNQIQRPTNVSGAVPSATSEAVVPPRTNTGRAGILSRLNPFKSRQAPARMPQHPAQPMPVIVPRQPNGEPSAQPQVAPAPNQVNKAARPSQVPVAPSGIVPAPSAGTDTTAVRSELSDTLPPVPGDPGYQDPDANNGDETPTAKPDSSVDDALQNSFDEMPEAAADDKAEPQSEAQENPFSGLSLDEPLAVPPQPSPAKANLPTDEPLLEFPTNTNSDTELDSIPLPAEPVQAETSKTDVAATNLDSKMRLL